MKWLGWSALVAVTLCWTLLATVLCLIAVAEGARPAIFVSLLVVSVLGLVFVAAIVGFKLHRSER